MRGFWNPSSSSDAAEEKSRALQGRPLGIAQKTMIFETPVFDVLPAGMEIAKPLPPFIEATPTGLILAKDLTFEEWQAIGVSFGKAVETAIWCIGDWLVYGDDKWGRQLSLPGFDAPRSKVSRDAYEAAVFMTGKNLQTLMDIASVCRRLPRQIRVEGLSFDHHRAIATAPAEEQSKWFQIVAPLSKPPSAKRIRLSIRLAKGNPRIISDEEVTNRGEHAGHENYIPLLTKLQTLAMKQLPEMSEYQKTAFFEDHDLYCDLVNRYR